jgi:hypothetical protein
MTNGLNFSEAEKKGYFMERTLKHVTRVINNAGFLFKYDSKRFKDLPEQTKSHDISKFSDEEMEPYIKLTYYYMCKAKGVEIEELSKEDKDKVLDAVFHHLKNNKHHPEYYDDAAERSRDGVIIDATKMPDLSIAEMVCDWMSMSQEFNNDIHKFAESVVNKKFLFNKEQVNLINELIGALEDGQKSMFE